MIENKEDILDSDFVEVDNLTKPPKEMLNEEFKHKFQQKKNSFNKPCIFALLLKGNRSDMALVHTYIKNGFPDLKIFFIKSYPDSTQLFVLTGDDFVKGDN